MFIYFGLSICGAYEIGTGFSQVAALFAHGYRLYFTCRASFCNSVKNTTYSIDFIELINFYPKSGKNGLLNRSQNSHSHN